MKVHASGLSKRSQQLAKVAGLKAHVGPASFRFTDDQLLRLIEHVGDLPLACDAICMIPRPAWVTELLGA
jgi:hypothetical protein